jgi:hypothetical protein
MDTNEQQEIKHLLQKESDATRYMLVSFMFGVFFLATLKDLLSPGGLTSAFIIIRVALIVAFFALAIYFYLQAKGMLDEDEADKLDDYYASLEEKAEIQQTFLEKYFINARLKSFKKAVYILWAIIFVIFMALAMLSFGPEPTAEETANGTTKTTTTTTPATTTPTTTK